MVLKFWSQIYSLLGKKKKQRIKYNCTRQSYSFSKGTINLKYERGMANLVSLFCEMLRLNLAFKKTVAAVTVFCLC